MMKFLLWIAVATTLFAASSPAADSSRKNPAAKPNILFIAVDDLNHWVGYTGRNPQTKTPNIDRLSKMGVSFMRADCAAPLCNPSRAALMSGLRPSSTGCYENNQNWKKFIPEGLGLAATFKNAGYYVAGAGKIYHGNTFYPAEWDDYMSKSGTDEDEHGPKGVTKTEGFQEPVKHDLKDQDLADWKITDYCIKQLGEKHDRPFFLACGLHKPHLPWVVPRKYYDLFPLEGIQLPPYQKDDLTDIPQTGKRMANESGDHQKILDSNRWKAAIQSYLAAIAYTDMNVGRLLDALDKSPQRDNTIVVFWGDHGWHLGEKHHWRKFALWEEAVRAPLIWVAPGLTRPGTICQRPVDFMSIYPTLCDLAGVPIPRHVEGASIKSLLANPKAAWSTPTLCTFGYQNHTVRNEQWRYIRYANGGEELYDHSRDPYEWTNVVHQAEFAQVREDLAKSFPRKNAGEASGKFADAEDENAPAAKDKKRKSKK
jgi:arylsulfatase A-like enzyme